MEDAELPLGTPKVEPDTLTIYGFTFNYPRTSKLEFNPKFKRDGGDVAVKSSEKAVVFVSWGDLTKLTKTPTVEGHAKSSLDRVKKSVQGKMNQVDREEIDVNGHTALYNRVKVEYRPGLFGRSREQAVTSVHLHCEKSGRFFVVYGTSESSNAESQESTIREILGSLRCHQ